MKERRFICDRMVGSLCRYLRLMGYDTLDANDLPPGNRREDTNLLNTANREYRLILTRDAELARRGREHALYLTNRKVADQITQLVRSGLISPELRLTRCSLCNSLLVPIEANALSEMRKKIQDFNQDSKPVFWCNRCYKAYWEGSHTINMRSTLAAIAKDWKENRTNCP